MTAGLDSDALTADHAISLCPALITLYSAAVKLCGRFVCAAINGASCFIRSQVNRLYTYVHVSRWSPVTEYLSVCLIVRLSVCVPEFVSIHVFFPYCLNLR